VDTRFGDKRYHAWNGHLRAHFGEKISKIPLDAGFTCPNRDGTLATGGCTFCSARGSGDFAGSRRLDLIRQYEAVRASMARKWPGARSIAYFQAFTNTYAPVPVLREMFETALQFPDVVGLAIATRPDCLPPDVVELLAELNQRTYLWVELGLQTVHESTSRRIGRAHDTATFVRALTALQDRGIRTCTHVIFGLPGESDAMMRATAKMVARMPTQGVKIHLLHLLRGTPMVAEYERGEFELLTQERYIGLVCDALEMLPPDMVIHRLTGDGPPDLLIGPLWSRRKWEVLNAIEGELVRRDSWQGKRFDGVVWAKASEWEDVTWESPESGAAGSADAAAGLRSRYPVFLPHGAGRRGSSS